MIKAVTILLAFLFTATVNAQSYFDSYPGESQAALSFYRSNRNIIDSVALRFGLDAAEAFSIVAPEVGHYALWRDMLEIGAVRLFYEEMGTEYADFSIGYFQMKLSFIEKLEVFVRQYESELFGFVLKFQAADDPGVRRERINRLGQLKWQMAYLCAFIKTAKRIHGNEIDYATLATAYNAGFWKTRSELTTQSTVKSFPQKGLVTIKFSYAEIAAEYQESLTDQ